MFKTKNPSLLPKELKETVQTQRCLKAIGALAKTYGLNSFVFGYKDPDSNQAIIHFETIPLNEAVSLCGMGWIHALQNELKSHPEYKDDYAAIFKDAIKDFGALTQKINKRVAEYQVKNQPVKK